MSKSKNAMTNIQVHILLSSKYLIALPVMVCHKFLCCWRQHYDTPWQWHPLPCEVCNSQSCFLKHTSTHFTGSSWLYHCIQLYKLLWEEENTTIKDGLHLPQLPNLQMWSQFLVAKIVHAATDSHIKKENNHEITIPEVPSAQKSVNHDRIQKFINSKAKGNLIKQAEH